jgi:hypothetical protein
LDFDGSGRRVCRPNENICEGVCFPDPRQCCGRAVSGSVVACRFDQMCCADSFGANFRCCEAHQRCTSAGCQ